jgi:pimeloyl-ACP methyl ester carboxylesterase
MPSKLVNGAELYYEDTEQGFPALFVHGMCGYAGVWDRQVALLRDDVRCVTYDRRGHTRSSLGTIGARTVELHADDAVGLLRELQVGPCLLVASSGGARIGIDLLRRYPELFAAAVLSEPPIFGLDPEGGGRQVMADLRPLLESAFARHDPRGAVDAFFECMCPGLWRQLDDAQKEPYRANHRELMGDLEMRPYQIAPDDLSAMSTPSVIVSGSNSHPSLRRVARAIADAMPHGSLVEMEGIGHVTYAEAPELFAAVVRQSLRPSLKS